VSVSILCKTYGKNNRPTFVLLLSSEHEHSPCKPNIRGKSLYIVSGAQCQKFNISLLRRKFICPL